MDHENEQPPKVNPLPEDAQVRAALKRLEADKQTLAGRRTKRDVPAVATRPKNTTKVPAKQAYLVLVFASVAILGAVSAMALAVIRGQQRRVEPAATTASMQAAAPTPQPSQQPLPEATQQPTPEVSAAPDAGAADAAVTAPKPSATVRPPKAVGTTAPPKSTGFVDPAFN